MREFIKKASIRAVRTISQTALALIPCGVMLHEVDWVTVILTSLLSGILSMLTSIATGLPEVEE